MLENDSVKIYEICNWILRNNIRYILKQILINFWKLNSIFSLHSSNEMITLLKFVLTIEAITNLFRNLYRFSQKMHSQKLNFGEKQTIPSVIQILYTILINNKVHNWNFRHVVMCKRANNTLTMTLTGWLKQETQFTWNWMCIECKNVTNIRNIQIYICVCMCGNVVCLHFRQNTRAFSIENIFGRIWLFFSVS